MTTLTLITLTGCYVDVTFTFTKGYPATLEDPGCDDEVEIESVFYRGVDVWPLLNEDETQNLEKKIFNYEEEP